MAVMSSGRRCRLFVDGREIPGVINVELHTGGDEDEIRVQTNRRRPMELEGFLQAIKAEPTTNGPLLIFADFLEEEGASQEAEVLRRLCRRRECLVDIDALAAYRSSLQRDVQELTARVQSLERQHDAAKKMQPQMKAELPETVKPHRGSFDPLNFDPLVLQRAIEQERKKKR